MNKQKLAKWQRWLSLIENDVAGALAQVEVFDGFVYVHNRNIDHIAANHGARFCASIQIWYQQFASFAIRRQVDFSTDRDNRSLRNLLEELKDAASAVTYRSYLKAFPIDPNERFPWQEIIFGKFSNNGQFLSAEKIQEDIDHLDDLRKKVASQIDKTWAHLDKDAQNESVTRKITWGVLANGLGLLKSTTSKYLGLFHCASGKMGTVHSYPWMEIFRVPLNTAGPNTSGELGR